MNTEEFDQQYGPESRRQKGGYGDSGRIEAIEIYDAGHQALADYEEQEIINLPAFDNQMTKDEMINHLVHVHGVTSVRGKMISHKGGTKATKDEMISLHSRIHESLESGNAVLQVSGSRYDHTLNRKVPRFTLGGHSIPLARHGHLAVVVDDSVAAAAAAIRNNTPLGEKPLSVQERKVLQELVNNDFNGLKSEMRAFAADQLAHTKAEIEQLRVERTVAASSLVKKANRVKSQIDERVRKLKAKQAEEMRKLTEKNSELWDEIMEEANAAEVAFSNERQPFVEEKDGKRVESTRTVLVAKPLGIEAMIERAEKDNKTYLARAEMTLERQRLDAQRRVLVSGVTAEAAGLLDQIPSARDLMVEAAAAAAATQPKALQS